MAQLELRPSVVSLKEHYFCQIQILAVLFCKRVFILYFISYRLFLLPQLCVCLCERSSGYIITAVLFQRRSLLITAEVGVHACVYCMFSCRNVCLHACVRACLCVFVHAS